MALMHVYEVRPRKDKRGVDLISDPLPFGRPVSVSGGGAQRFSHRPLVPETLP